VEANPPKVDELFDCDCVCFP